MNNLQLAPMNNANWRGGTVEKRRNFVHAGDGDGDDIQASRHGNNKPTNRLNIVVWMPIDRARSIKIKRQKSGGGVWGCGQINGRTPIRLQLTTDFGCVAVFDSFKFYDVELSPKHMVSAICAISFSFV